MNTTDQRLYITELNNLERLYIQFVPNELAINRAPTYGTINIVGRNTPVPHYTGGSTKLTLALDFYAERENREDVVEKCSWLQALAYNDGYSNPPPNVRLTFGDLFKNDVWIVKSVSVRYTDFHKNYGYLPVQAYVNLTLELDPSYNLKRSQVLWR